MKVYFILCFDYSHATAINYTAFSEEYFLHVEWMAAGWSISSSSISPDIVNVTSSLPSSFNREAAAILAVLFCVVGLLCDWVKWGRCDLDFFLAEEPLLLDSSSKLTDESSVNLVVWFLKNPDDSPCRKPWLMRPNEDAQFSPFSIRTTLSVDLFALWRNFDNLLGFLLVVISLGLVLLSESSLVTVIVTGLSSKVDFGLISTGLIDACVSTLIELGTLSSSVDESVK